METKTQHSDASYGMYLSDEEGQNPQYPPQSSLPPSSVTDASPSAGGLARRTSRKRRTSEDHRNFNNFPYPPTAPEVPKAPPSSYRASPAQGNEELSTNVGPGSFAQRAAILTGRSISHNHNGVSSESSNPATAGKPERRKSLNRPIGGLYSEIQQHRRDSYPASARSPTSPKQRSHPSSPLDSRTKQPIPENRQHTAAPNHSSVGNSPRESTSDNRRPSALAASPREKWAADRSPLQKLEVTLTDKSKEEKRARVEAAEQRLRESKLATQRKSDQDAVNQRRHHQQEQPLTGKPPARSPSSSQAARGRNATGADELQHTPLRHDPKSRAAHSNSITRDHQSADRGVRFHDVDGPDDEEDYFNMRTGDTGFPQESSRKGQGSSQGGRGDQRPLSNMSSASKRVPPQQQQLYDNRAQRSSGHDSGDELGGQQDTVPPQPVANGGQAPKQKVPAQSTAGLQAKHKVDFSKDAQRSPQPSSKPKHRLSNVLHQERSDEAALSRGAHERSRQLDEWRQAGVARLTTDDFLDEHGDTNPWWENRTSNSRRRSQRGSIGTDDVYQAGSGKYSTFPSNDQSTAATPITKTYRTRPYGPAGEFLKSKHPSSPPLKGVLGGPLRFPRKMQPTRLDAVYSYSCPSLAQHISSPSSDHICKPYLSKELMRSMRSIRVRTVPTSTTFSPPLYLKSGPLLRYTGMKRDRLQTHGRAGPQSSERETWRGSVMIVTTDADSDYSPVPTLRLFPEPMEKLPPPQQEKAEGDGSDDLPMHYMDPIAGLPKLSRTGKTVYVKPVDDLEEGRDLSRFESDDDGLFEDFRSAAVPTAYGTPDYRHGQNGPSPRQSRQRPKQKKGHRVRGVRLHAERGITFWRFNLEVELQSQETRIAYSINNGPAVGFWVPGRNQTMNIMFHSCNGFSLSAK